MLLSKKETVFVGFCSAEGIHGHRILSALSIAELTNVIQNKSCAFHIALMLCLFSLCIALHYSFLFHYFPKIHLPPLFFTLSSCWSLTFHMFVLLYSTHARLVSAPPDILLFPVYSSV